MWWTVLTVVLVVVGVVVVFGGAMLFRYGGKAGPTIPDVEEQEFRARWGQRPFR